MLFPESSPAYYDEKHRDIIERMETFYAQSITINQSFWSQADIDTRFEVGDQTLWNELYGNLPIHQRRSFNFNRIRPIINMISGHQRQHRKSTIVTPRENADQETADQFSKLMYWANSQDNVLETISESFHGSLVSGMNMLQLWVDYRKDPVSGNIRVENCNYNSFLIDPYFKKADLSDCNGLWKRSYLSKRECISLLPGYTEEILELAGNPSGTAHDSKFQFMPESQNYGSKNLLTYDEFYYRDYRTQKMLVDTNTGETMEWKSDDKKALEAFLQYYPEITVLDQEVPTVRLAIVVQGRVIYDGPNPVGLDEYPFVPVFAYYNPQLPYFQDRIQGVVRNIRDAQYLYNRRRVIELDILESQINSGVKYKEGSLVNPKDAFLQGQGRSLALKKEAQMDDVQQMVSPQIPPSMFQLSENLAKDITNISGVNEELLGSALDDKAGVLSMLRQGAGLTTLQTLFDHLDRSQKRLGNLMLQVMQNNFTPGKVKRIIEQEPTKQFYHKAFGLYDAVVEEGLNTSTQRQMQFAQMLQLKETGVPISSKDLLEAATIQNKTDLIKNVQEQERMQAEQHKLEKQAYIQELESKANKSQAQASADRGLAVERASRVQENRALAIERLAESAKDRAKANEEDELATLHKIEALKKLEQMDLQSLEKMIKISDVLKESQQQQSMTQNNRVSLDELAADESAQRDLDALNTGQQNNVANLDQDASMQQDQQNTDQTMQNQMSALSQL